MSNKKYWQNFGELNDTPAKKEEQDEFKELLPFEDSKGLLDAKASRRDFLKYLGFSTAAAVAASSCEMPVRKVIPYVNKPEEIIPGVANLYASTYIQDGNAIPIVVKVRDGRPIKIEGNTLSPITNGGTSARVQASVLDLYDTSRLRYPMANGKEVSSFEALDKMVMDDIVKLNGKPIVILTSSIVSPSTQSIINTFLDKYKNTNPASRHVVFNAISYNGMLLANDACYGIKALPSYKFDNANVIVSIGADFLGTWLNPVVFSKQYASGRKIKEHDGNPQMSKHYQFESHLSITGANADERFTHRPSETGAVLTALYAALTGGTISNINDDKLKKAIEKVAKDLLSNKSSAILVCGSNNMNDQIITNAINNVINANGNTIHWEHALYGNAMDVDMIYLVNEMNAGKIGGLFVMGANPLYEYYDAKGLANAIQKVPLTVSFNIKLDETAEHCKYIIPNHHYLESWGDAEYVDGEFSFIQPTINPLFKTRHWQDSLLKWSGNNNDYATFLKNYWTTTFLKEEGWEKALQDGVTNAQKALGGYKPNPSIPTFKINVNDIVAKINSNKKGGKAELVLYQKVAIGEGKQANNPWLHEMPDPITKATWDNYAMISISMAKELGIELGDSYEVHPEKPVIKITAKGKELELPVLVIPGMQANTIAVAVGYGRSEKIGKAAANVGKNVYHWVNFNGTTFDYFISDISYAKTDKTYKIAQTQTHSSYEGRTEVVKEASLEKFKKEPNVFQEEREELAKDFAPKTGNYRTEATLYPSYEKQGIHWNMSIDLNSCIGCGSCVVACNAENNIPVVGKSEVMRAHEMHWLRIDRYFVSDEKKPEELSNVIFQPMLCQHCDNAPCENVCPVNATNHSSEGLNQMIYNRCIGTRYCANNCPYKVRRFNWADYMGADSFPNNQDESSDVILMMNDELTRMVLNPDVTVRSRGVMEKCTFCAQRLQAAKLGAKKESRPLKDGEAKTACMQACPTNAIVFGNVKDKESDVHKIQTDNKKRLYYVLEQLHVLPNVSYLAKVHNTEEEKV